MKFGDWIILKDDVIIKVITGKNENDYEWWSYKVDYGEKEA